MTIAYSSISPARMAAAASVAPADVHGATVVEPWTSVISVTASPVDRRYCQYRPCWSSRRTPPRHVRQQAGELRSPRRCDAPLTVGRWPRGSSSSPTACAPYAERQACRPHPVGPPLEQLPRSARSSRGRRRARRCSRPGSGSCQRSVSAWRQPPMSRFARRRSTPSSGLHVRRPRLTHDAARSRGHAPAVE